MEYSSREFGFVATTGNFVTDIITPIPEVGVYLSHVSKNRSVQHQEESAVRLLLRRKRENRPKAVGKVCSEWQLRVHVIPLVDA
ncbi:hypothetical protein J6590_098628 [Homalodisca vitripennis]|nr:hypothetical protein J6590_098628 [Homalodisca vitripennis]